MSGSQVESWIYDVADKTPEKINELVSDRDLKMKIFINKLIDNRIWDLTNGKYMCGKDVIGVNLDYAISFLKDPKNKELIKQWGSLVSMKTGNQQEEVTTVNDLNSGQQ
jgi:hypothetical protein